MKKKKPGPLGQTIPLISSGDDDDETTDSMSPSKAKTFAFMKSGSHRMDEEEKKEEEEEPIDQNHLWDCWERKKERRTDSLENFFAEQRGEEKGNCCSHSFCFLFVDSLLTMNHTRFVV